MTAEAQGPDGARVTFTASATDNLDGPISPKCSPSSGSTFHRGTTTVTCSVTDARGNDGKGTFTVTVADTKAPAVALPPSLTVEANSPLGSVVTYTVSAVDVADGPLPPASIRCAPASGNRFPLGRTQVQCRAADTSGNAATREMTVTVVDSTAPVLTVPAPIALTAPATGRPATEPTIARFLGGARAEDMVDSRPTLRHDAPAVFPLGQTTVTFVATDSFGNWEIGKSSVTLYAQPLAAPPPAAVDRIPPDNVSALRAERGDARVRLRWRRPPTPDFERVEILRSENQVGAAQTRVFRGSETTFLDRALVNGTAYRYVVVSYDRAGNRSPGVAIVATPKATMLLKPLEGARISRAPTLTWARARGATYYNVQLYRGVHKALSIWLERTSFKIKRQWTFAGRRERLRPGFYRWYVWPGIGDPALGNYGPMLGESSFTIVR
jgi:HYR domain